MLLETSFLLPDLFCNVEFELIQLISQHQTVAKEILLEFQTIELIEDVFNTFSV